MATATATRDGAVTPSVTAADHALAAILAVVAGFVSALFSWVPSFWTDEAASISSADRPVAEIGALISSIDAVHAVYYVALHGWRLVVGDDEFGIRALSVGAIVLAAAGTYWLGRLTGGRRLGVAAALVFAILPRVTWAGIEARPFALALAGGVWATVLLVAATRHRRAGWWIGYALVAGFAVATNIYAALLVAGHGLSLLLLRSGRGVLLRWLGAAVGAAVLSSPILLLSVAERGQIAPNPIGFAEWVRNVLVNQWFLGGTPTGVLPERGTPAWQFAAVAAAAIGWLLVLVGAVAALRRRASPAPGTGAPGSWPALAWALPAVVLPTVVLGVYVLAVDPMYNPRYLTFTSFAVALLVGVGLLALRRRWWRVVAAALLVAAVAPVWWSQRTPDAKSGADYRAVGDYLREHAGTGDGVYFAPRSAGETGLIGLSSRRIAVSYPDDFARLTDVTWAVDAEQSDTIDDLSRPLDQVTARLRAEDRLWVVRRIDAPARQRADEDAVLRSAGLTGGRTVYSGSLDEIAEYRRPG
ncbi:mannosyltransferase [Tersicoccus solisilvae]|uniref:Mannosyltransferase n=1 Tax=Tersicoccus solisilvae TaxID=1882339 RepID=A0ABQ1NZR0_9MICC|nr:glycosyltransferase family 39 protein [Tersicoccus solisilvae]GGC88172.1 mannosyltransferase [Tersicoccus solisilvae]